MIMVLTNQRFKLQYAPVFGVPQLVIAAKVLGAAGVKGQMYTRHRQGRGLPDTSFFLHVHIKY